MDAIVADDTKTPFHNPFAALGHLRGKQDHVEGGTSVPPNAPGLKTRPPSAPKADPNARTIPRAVVRLERSGRGGKEVTVVEQLPLNATEREQWLKALKSALGCGGSLEGESIVIQGDQRKRLPALLTARGVKKVTVG